MDPVDVANDIVKSLRDARNNDDTRLVKYLEGALSKVNEEIVARGFAPVKA